MTRRLITDRPEWTGYLDGFDTVSEGTRRSRKEYISDSQQPAYERGYRKGAKDAFKDREEIEGD